MTITFGDPRLPERFWNKVKVQGECWIWQANTKAGYGYFYWDGRDERVHRITYGAFVSVVPAKLKVCHTCDRPKCCYPNHLFLGRQLDNIHDAIMKHRGGNTRLTIEQIKQIKQLLTEGTHTYTRIGKIFGVSRTTVSSINSGKVWRHL